MPTIIGRNATVRYEQHTITAVESGDINCDQYVVPGFVDIQVNGIDEIDFGIARDEHAIADALDRMTAHGTTSCLPTVVSAKLDQYDAMLDRVRRARELDDAATRCSILGVHLEGPFLGGAPGAHPQHLIRNVELDWLRTTLDRHADLIKLITLAPEADPGFEGIKLCREYGVFVALGHSDCSYETAIAAVDAGATIATHLYNGMSGLHHRNPGLATAALLDDRITPSIIADLHHVSAPALRVAFAAKARLALITDAVAPGAGESGSMKIEQRGGVVFLQDGTLAGAVIHMIDAFNNCVTLGLSIERVAKMAATYPCDAIEVADRGRLTPGARADLVTLKTQDGNLTIQQVLVQGLPCVP